MALREVLEGSVSWQIDRQDSVVLHVRAATPRLRHYEVLSFLRSSEEIGGIGKGVEQFEVS